MPAASVASTTHDVAARELLHSISGLATRHMLSQGMLSSQGLQRRRPPPSSSSSDDEDLDDRASALLRQMSRHTSAHAPSVSTAPSRQLLLVHQTPPQSRPGTAASTINTSLLEESLRQQTAALILQQQREIEAHRDSLQQALDEVQRIREAEEAALARRIEAARSALSQDMAEMQLQFQQQARQLENRADEYVAQQRRATEAAVAHSVRRISSALSSPRPAPGRTPDPAAPGRAGGWGTQLSSPGSSYERPAPTAGRSPGKDGTLRYSPPGDSTSPYPAAAAAPFTPRGASAGPATPLRSLSDEFTLLDDQHRVSFFSPQPHSAFASSRQPPPSHDMAPWLASSPHHSLSRPSASSWRAPPPAPLGASPPWAGSDPRTPQRNKPRTAPLAAAGQPGGSARPRPHTPVRGSRLLGLGRRLIEVEALHRAQPRVLKLLEEALDD